MSRTGIGRLLHCSRHVKEGVTRPKRCGRNGRHCLVNIYCIGVQRHAACNSAPILDEHSLAIHGKQLLAHHAQDVQLSLGSKEPEADMSRPSSAARGYWRRARLCALAIWCEASIHGGAAWRLPCQARTARQLVSSYLDTLGSTAPVSYSRYARSAEPGNVSSSVRRSRHMRNVRGALAHGRGLKPRRCAAGGFLPAVHAHTCMAQCSGSLALRPEDMCCSLAK